MPTPAPIPRDPYGVALTTLRRLSQERSFAPGEALVVTELAEKIGLSPTPVREALACLAGEGLIDRRKGKGYTYPADPAPILLDLYALQRAYVHAALTLYFSGSSGLQKMAPLVPGPLASADIFAAAVAQSGNAALIDAHRRVAQRLSIPDQADRALDPGLERLFQEMANAMGDGLRDRLLRLVDDHYAARCGRAWRVVSALREARSQSQPS